MHNLLWLAINAAAAAARHGWHDDLQPEEEEICFI